MSNVEKTNSEVPVENQQAVIDQLQKQLQKLEKQLQFEKDRNYALNTLIDIAEEQGIRIRKKNWGQAVERLCEKKDYTVKYSCSLLDHTKHGDRKLSPHVKRGVKNNWIRF